MLKLKQKQIKVVLICIISILLTELNVRNVRAVYAMRSVYLMGIVDEDGSDRTSWITGASNAWNKANYVNIYKKTAFTATNLQSYLKKANVLLILTHGNKTTIKAVDSKGKESYVYVADINKYSSSDLSNLKLFVSMACCNGKGGSSAKNIVNSIYSKGAKTSIGCTTTTYNPQAGDWLTHFSMAMGISGKTVSEAMSIADSFVLMLNSSPGGTNNRLVRGSVNYSLKIK